MASAYNCVGKDKPKLTHHVSQPFYFWEHRHRPLQDWIENRLYVSIFPYETGPWLDRHAVTFRSNLPPYFIIPKSRLGPVICEKSIMNWTVQPNPEGQINRKPEDQIYDQRA